MKALVLAPKSRYDVFGPETPSSKLVELIFCDRGGTAEQWLSAGWDADALFVTPVTVISESLISKMPNLRLIHSEGVGFDRIDLKPRKPAVSMCATTPDATRRRCRSCPSL